jgi:RNA polymerase sigma-70 factor (ECF subfamily)
LNDRQLISALKRRQKHALRQYISKYHKSVALTVEAVAGRILSPQDKEEIVADVFITLWQSAEQIDDETYLSIKPYLGRIARNKTKNALRKQGNLRNFTLPLEEAILVSSREELSEDLIRKELQNTLKKLILSLSVEEQNCFIKYYYYQLPIRMIAEECGLSESTVKVKLFRGRKKLRKLLEERGISYENYKDILL